MEKSPPVLKSSAKQPHVLKGSNTEFKELDRLEDSNNPYNHFLAYKLEKKLHQRELNQGTDDEGLSTCCSIM